MSRFANRGVIVTGGAKGIGAAAVRGFCAEGAKVLIADVDIETASALASELGSDRAIAFSIDVTDPDSVNACVKTALERFGTLDVLVNSAGITDQHPALDLPVERFRHVMAVNAEGLFAMCQAFARHVKAAQQPGSIVNVSSTAGLWGVPNRPVYTASKHAVVGLTREMALDWAAFGLRVNAVAPGMVLTPMTERYFENEADAERLRKSTPLGRVGRPEEIAEVILFLASDAASFVSGAIVPVDGAFTAGKGR